MKTSVVLFTTLMTLTFLDLALAGRGNRGRNRNGNDGCRYDRKSGQWSECDPTTNKMTKTMSLKNGQPSTCDPTKTVHRPCSKVNAVGCEYERKVSDCVDNKRTITFTLISGPDSCPQKEPKEKPCGRPGKNKNRKEKKAERKARRQERRNNRNNGGEP